MAASSSRLHRRLRSESCARASPCLVGVFRTYSTPGEGRKKIVSRVPDDTLLSDSLAMPNNSHESGNTDFIKTTTLYREFQAEREEILRHKWFESEKAGYDIGF